MPDLYAINLFLQERLEADWRKEVSPSQAARWLQEAGLLPDGSSGAELRELLAAGRIAGQQRRPDRKKGSWRIRRLAETRDPQSIQEARRRMRTYLPLDRAIFHPDWPLSRDNSAFWEELGKAVAAFGYLENTLVSACYSLTPPPADPRNIRAEQIPAHLQWYAEVEAFRADSLHVLAGRFDKLLRKDGRVPHTVRDELRKRLEELRHWRNSLCHGAWFGFSGDGDGVLSHYTMKNKQVTQFPPMVSLKDLAELRARVVDAIVTVEEAASVAGSGSAAATVFRRQYEPLNSPPDPEYKDRLMRDGDGGVCE